ncbi:hypothetical protein CLU79DRAFT_255811 [Phycomyces nitens]|nr:hypothetical protein CLU79DRAFT_255811 [Phycomyces nitens]
MLEYFQSADHDICLASIDSAGLSTSSNIAKDLLEEYLVINKMVIEPFLLSDNQSTILQNKRII